MDADDFHWDRDWVWVDLQNVDLHCDVFFFRKSTSAFCFPDIAYNMTKASDFKDSAKF